MTPRNSSGAPLADLGSLRLLLIRPPHGINGFLYALNPPPAHEERLKFLANRKLEFRVQDFIASMAKSDENIH